jgi:glutathione S-transferase
MLTLLSHQGGGGLYSLSPFCTKAAYLLEMSGQPWQREDFSDLAATPHHKLPVLREGGQLIPDSEGIRRFLESKGADFDAGLSALQKAHARQIIRMVDESLILRLLCARWFEPAGWQALRQTIFADAPAEVVDHFRAGVLAGLHFTGITRFGKEERLLRLDQDLTALTATLGDQPFLFGDAPTAADCSLAPMVEALSRFPADPETAERAAKHSALVAYADRVAQHFALALPVAA